MTDRVMIRLNEITESATIDQIKYWCKLLDIQPKIISRAAHVTAEQSNIILKMAEFINQGIRPKDAAGMLIETAVTVSPVRTEADNGELLNRIESLEKAVLLLVDHNKKLADTIEKQNDAHNIRLKEIQLRLEPPKPLKRIVKPWQPEEKKQPEYPFLRKLWYELIHPEMLRA